MNRGEARVGQAVRVKGSRIVYEIRELSGQVLNSETGEYEPAAVLVRADRKHSRHVWAKWENVSPSEVAE